jgi:hypothetical protein
MPDRHPVDWGPSARLSDRRAPYPRREAAETDDWRQAYDSAELREGLDARGTKPSIPNRCNRQQQPFNFSKASL